MKIETRTTQKTIVDSKRIYIAFDGKEFPSSWQCREYERDIVVKELIATGEVERCEQASGSAPFDGGWNSEEHGWEWFKARTKHGLDALAEIYKPSYGMPAIGLNEWFCIEDIDGDCWWSTLESHMEYVKMISGFLGFDVELKKRA